MIDHMELVEGQRGSRERFLCAADECGRHVDANVGDRLRLPAMRGKGFGAAGCSGTGSKEMIFSAARMHRSLARRHVRCKAAQHFISRSEPFDPTGIEDQNLVDDAQHGRAVRDHDHRCRLQLEPFDALPLAFAWVKDDGVPLILGHVNFFASFDVCFFGASSEFEIKPRQN